MRNGTADFLVIYGLIDFSSGMVSSLFQSFKCIDFVSKIIIFSTRIKVNCLTGLYGVLYAWMDFVIELFERHNL